MIPAFRDIFLLQLSPHPKYLIQLLVHLRKMRIYITHCSAKKDTSLKETAKKVTPEKLYTAAPLQRFMSKCKERGVQWAILSDRYGIWFPEKKNEWYEKDPNTVTEREFRELVSDFEQKLGNYDEVYFYHNPGRFHSLYRRLLREAKVNAKIVLFSHLSEIV